MFIACTRSSPPIVVHGVVEDGKIQEILPSGKKVDIICNRQEFRPSISDRIIRSITMRPSLEVPLIVKDPNSDKREILSINVRDLNRVTERISRQRESLIIRGLFQEDSTREGLGFVELDEIHKICLSEELQAFDEIKVGNGRIIKYRDKWHKVRHEADGGSLKVAVCDQFAVKILKEGMFVPEHLKSAKDVDDLLRRINKDNNATGVEKRPVSPMRNRQFATYDISGSGEVIKQLYSRAVQVEVPFASDCKNALRKNWIQKEEVCSLAACLVEGSKTLIEARVYPLDVKLANIAYLGRERQLISI